MSRKPKKPEPPKPFKQEVFTFTKTDLEHPLCGVRPDDTPSCFNGIVCVRKYRLTVELVDEPIEVIHERLLDLWETCDNHHHWGPLQREASRYGLELPDERRGIRQPEKKKGW